jgi:hypothetical protein
MGEPRKVKPLDACQSDVGLERWRVNSTVVMEPMVATLPVPANGGCVL